MREFVHGLQKKIAVHLVQRVGRFRQILWSVPHSAPDVDSGASACRHGRTEESEERGKVY